MNRHLRFPFPENSINQKTLKIYELALMIAYMAEYLAGVRKLDDRDSWSNKRLEGAPALMSQLFVRVLSEKVFGELERRFDRRIWRILNRLLAKFDLSISQILSFLPSLLITGVFRGQVILMKRLPII